MPSSETTTLLGRSRSAQRAKDQIFLQFLLILCYIMMICYSITIFVGPFLLYREAETEWCTPQNNRTTVFEGSTDSEVTDTETFPIKLTGYQLQYMNPEYNGNPCRTIRLPQLLGLTLIEADYCRRLFTSVFLGGVIGYERRTKDRPAGIRTMALVSLGACSFTLSSMSAYHSSVMFWDSARTAGGLASGVGFLGGAIIWKGTVSFRGREQHQVHGLTTAASVWFSAAVGIGAGGALYFVAIYGTIIVLLVLRFGPSVYLKTKSEGDVDMEREAGDETKSGDGEPNFPTFES